MSSTIKIKAPAMPEPFWHAVVSRTAPIIDKAIRRADVAQEYADKAEENYGHVVDIEVKQLFTADQLAARDAQWQEMYGPVVVALVDVMFRHVQFANKQDYAERARAALSAITEE